jgi:Flp pilus assembly protein TadB
VTGHPPGSAIRGRLVPGAGLRRVLSAVWVCGLLVSAVAVVAAAYLPPVTTAVVLTQVIPLPVHPVLITWTQRRFGRQAPELHAARPDAGP